MTPELQTLVDRLELLERQSRGWKLTAFFAFALALVALIVPALRDHPGLPERARFSSVEANRFLLRSPGGDVTGGLEVDARGTIRLVLGTGRTAAAFLEVGRDGVAQLSLRGLDGATRAALVGADRPALALAPAGMKSTALLMTREDGAGSVLLTDAVGRQRFRAP